MLRSLIASAAVFLLVLNGCMALADPVTGTYEPVPEGYLVQFVVHNSFSGNLWYWLIATNDATTPTGPEGWRISQNFREVAWDTRDTAYVIPPGQSLGGFGFTSKNPPGTLGWGIHAGGWSYLGSVTPTLIPEPSSLLALGLAASWLGGVALRRRKR